MAVTVSNNIEETDVDDVGFVDPDNDDFHLLESSAAVEAGSDEGYAPFDYDDVARPQGEKADIGAYEFIPGGEEGPEAIAMTLRAHNFTALWNEIDRLAAETRQLREKVARGWELGRPEGVEVYNTSELTIATGSWDALTFNSERRDDAGFHSTVTNTSRLTVPAGLGGRYIIAGHATFLPSTAGTFRKIGIFLNGSTCIAVAVTPWSGQDLQCEMTVPTEYPLTAGDYVELWVMHNVGDDLNVQAAGNYTPEFRMLRIM